MPKVSRRGFLGTSGGGLATILATGKAPAYAQGTTVHWLKWADFVPAADTYLRREGLPAAEKALGIKINLETIGLNDLQARATAAIQSKSGPDIIMAFNNHPQLYAESLADVSAVTEVIGPKQGGYYEIAKANTHDGKRWIAVPYCIVGLLIAYRKSWFDEIGFTTFPETWEAYREAGRRLKAKGRPIGQTLGHTVGDSPSFTYPYLWSFGGKEVEADGRTVVLNSPETVESVKFMTAFWKDAHDEGGLAWDDASNNRAFLAGTVCATLNGASIYIEAVRRADQYKTETGAQLRTDIRHAKLPRGPAGQYAFHAAQSMMVMGYSRNQKAAMDFLRWFHEAENYDKWFTTLKGFVCGPTRVWETNKMWDEDPVMTPYRAAAADGRVPGYAGPANQKSAEVLSKYIITDMYAKAVQGMPAEEAVKWADAELRKVYQG